MFSRRTGWLLTPNPFTEAQKRHQGAVLDLTLSNPTRAAITYDDDAILNSLQQPEVLNYDPQPKGLLSARNAVAQYYRADHRVVVDPQSIVLTTSTSEGYSYILRLLCDTGDEILVAKPSYPLFEFLADLNDVRLVPYTLTYDHRWQIDFQSLNDAVTERTRAVAVVHPNNPTGSFVTGAEKKQLNAFCEEHGLSLITDEVFLDYAHGAPRHETFASNRGALTFTLSGLSKISGLPQMKLAWVALSGQEEKVATAMGRLEIIADTYLSMNAPIQLAAPTLLDQRREVQAQLLKRVLGNLSDLDRQLTHQKTCTRLDVEGGWYAILRVPVTRSDEELVIELLQKSSVLVHPGHFYDFPSDGYLILSLITPAEDFSEGVRRILANLNA